MSVSSRIDLIHSSPVVLDAMVASLHRIDPTVIVGTTCQSWIEFVGAWDFRGPMVILDAFLDDHVPVALKVRALTRLGTRSVVLGRTPDGPMARRCRAEGAAGWIGADLRLDDAVRSSLRLLRSSDAGQSRPDAYLALTDRELQIASLYAGHHTPSVRRVARLLGRSPETVRVHLRSTRRKYRAAGIEVTSRATLAQALETDGLIVPLRTWVALGRR